MLSSFNRDIFEFIEACNQYQVRMILVGGSAVNYYGYKRHSADIDFWIDNSAENFERLLNTLNKIGYDLKEFPEDVVTANKNISLKFSPDLEIELITRFNSGKSFTDAFADSVSFEIKGQQYRRWNILSYDDLINSKIKSARNKDLLDVKELQRIKGKK
jgi:hypothetical protein